MRSILSNCQGSEVRREGSTGVVSEASKDTCSGALEVEFAEGKSILLVLKFWNYFGLRGPGICAFAQVCDTSEN